jgi:hypothetical protein
MCTNTEPLFLFWRHQTWLYHKDNLSQLVEWLHAETEDLSVISSILEHTEVMNTIKIVVFWTDTLYYTEESRGTLCLHLQD